MAWGPAGLVWLGLNLGTGDVTCTPTTGEITFTGNVPVVEEVVGGLQPHPLVWLGLNLRPQVGHATPSTGTITFTGNQPVVALPLAQVTPTTGVLSFVGNVSSVITTSVILPTTGVVTFTGNQAGVGQETKVVVPGAEVPALWYADVGHAARFSFMPVGMPMQNRNNVGPIDVLTTTGEITFTGNVPDITTDVTAQPTTGELEFTGGIASVALDAALEPGTGVLTFTGNVPGIDTEFLAEPVTGEILFTGYAPDVDAAPVIEPETGLITFLSQTPSVDIQQQFYTPEAEGVIVFYGNVPAIDGAVIGDGRRGKDGGLIIPGRKKPKPLLVKIDDEEFIVESVEEAEALLAQAKEVYQQQVNDLGMQLLERASKPTLEIKPVRMPRIRAEGPPGPDLDALVKEVQEMRSAIRDLYERAAAAQKRYINDDDEALALLL